MIRAGAGGGESSGGEGDWGCRECLDRKGEGDDFGEAGDKF